MTPSKSVYILTSIDSDGDTWIVNVCESLDTAQLARLLFAKQLVADGKATDVEAAIDRFQLRNSYSKIQSHDDVKAEYSTK